MYTPKTIIMDVNYLHLWDREWKGRYTKGAQLLKRVALFLDGHYPWLANVVAMCNVLAVKVVDNSRLFSNEMLFGDHLFCQMKCFGYLPLQ